MDSEARHERFKFYSSYGHPLHLTTGSTPVLSLCLQVPRTKAKREIEVHNRTPDVLAF